MYGNFTENIIDTGSISIYDIDSFIFYLLSDMAEGSSNITLSTKSRIAFHRSINIEDLEETSDTEVLITFAIDSESTNNANLITKLKNNLDSIKVEYRIMATMKRNFENNVELLKIIDKIQNSLTYNHNGTDSNPTPYIVTTATGKTFSTVFLNNELAGPYPKYSIVASAQDYLTATLNIVFSINRVYV